jgi:hypothetical protein
VFEPARLIVNHRLGTEVEGGWRSRGPAADRPPAARGHPDDPPMRVLAAPMPRRSCSDLPVSDLRISMRGSNSFL